MDCFFNKAGVKAPVPEQLGYLHSLAKSATATAALEIPTNPRETWWEFNWTNATGAGVPAPALLIQTWENRASVWPLVVMPGSPGVVGMKRTAQHAALDSASQMRAATDAALDYTNLLVSRTMLGMTDKVSVVEAMGILAHAVETGALPARKLTAAVVLVKNFGSDGVPLSAVAWSLAATAHLMRPIPALQVALSAGVVLPNIQREIGDKA